MNIALKGGCETVGTEPRVLGSEILPEKREIQTLLGLRRP